MGNWIGRSHHAGCRLAHKVGYSTRRDDLQGVMYIRSDSFAYNAPRNVRCDRTNC